MSVDLTVRSAHERMRKVLVLAMSARSSVSRRFTHMAETSLPPLNRHDGVFGFDHLETEGVLEAEPVKFSSCNEVPFVTPIHGHDPARTTAHLIRLSTSVCHLSEGIPRGSGYHTGYTPRDRWS